MALRVVLRDGASYVYCLDALEGGRATLDHLRPQAHFPATAPGSRVNDPRNLVTACPTCNQAKGPQDLHGFARMLRRRGLGVAVVRALCARVRAAVRRPLL
ncbi:MAG: HNH endonuclease [Deltaproteobacteria bacterium]|nr:HNH endonuclease [Deltaproteobacteria bacterium]